MSFYWSFLLGMLTLPLEVQFLLFEQGIQGSGNSLVALFSEDEGIAVVYFSPYNFPWFQL